MSTFVTAALIWILIGSLIWMINDPFKLIDVTIRAFVARNGRLPSAFVHVGMTALIMVAWPLVLRAMLKGFKAGYRQRRSLRHG